MATRKTALQFSEVPAWAIDSSNPSRYTIAPAFELVGFTGNWVRLTAATQRNLFGRNLFGKCRVRVTADGIDMVRSVSFGTDFSSVSLPWSQVEHYIATGEQIVF